MDINGVTIDDAATKSPAAQYIAERNKPRKSNETHAVTVLAADQPHALDNKAIVNDDAVVDEPTPIEAKEPWKNPETGEVKDKPTRGDKRRAKLWQERESERQMRVAAERERDDLKAQLAKRDAAPDPSAAAEPTKEQQDALTMAAQARIRPKPDRAAIGTTTYPTYEDYTEDCAIWGGELAAEKRELLRESRDADARATQVWSRFDHEREAARKEHSDWDAVMRDDVQLNPTIQNAVVNAPDGLKGHLLYWLATHLDDLQRIRDLDPANALMAMGEVIATVRAERKPKADDAADTKHKKPQSDAPEPPERSTARSSSTIPANRISDPGAAGVSPVDYIKAGNAAERARRRL